MAEKRYVRLFIVPLLLICGLHTLWAGVRWEEIFSNSQVPDGWQVIDNDGSGSGLDLVSALIPQPGSVVGPQVGRYFWSSNFRNASLAGVIDEWLISPQFSVIYAGDSLHFWAGAMDGPFKDSLRVLVSTTDNQLSGFTHEIGYLKADGPVGSWHRYSFDLSDFDSMDIYFAVNYHIRNGGSGGLNSDHVWIDHFMITGEVTELNVPPSNFRLLSPVNYRLLHPQADTTLTFCWNASHNTDNDPLRYTLKILDVFPELKFENIMDTCMDFNWQDQLNHYAAYRWTVGVTDGKSKIASPDTFLFITPPLDNLEPFAFDLVSPQAGDTVSMTDSVLFTWHPAFDANSDTLVYDLRVFGNGTDQRFKDITDTVCTILCSEFLEMGQSYSWEVYARDKEYETRSKQSLQFKTEDLSVMDGNETVMPGSHILYQNYPNPFNVGTIIRYTVGSRITGPQPVDLTVYTVNGEKIQTIVSEQQSAGTYELHWDGSGLATGIYLYKLSVGPNAEMRKMVLLK